ncbi:hypothetical protein AXX16_1763 [Serratia rubidaea]|nr:hypothetical protein AXX16_1763 [Serratia rubidaea]
MAAGKTCPCISPERKIIPLCVEYWFDFLRRRGAIFLSHQCYDYF